MINKLIIKILFILIPLNLSFGMVDGIYITGEKSVKVPVEKQDIPAPCNSRKKAGCAQLYAKGNNNKSLKFYTIDVADNFKRKIEKKFAKNHEEKNEISKFTANYNMHFLADLGMNNVPVLDQGDFGTCATFSTTALLDALKNAGDYVSQQCLLELGNYEEQKIDAFSGWTGSDHYTVLKRIQNYGVVDKKKMPA